MLRRSDSGFHGGAQEFSTSYRSPILLVRLGFASLLCAFVLTRLAVDPDLYGHIRFGVDIVQERALRASDPYSFTSDRPWVNHEWLAEAAMALVWLTGGAVALACLKAVLLIAALVIMRHRIVPGQVGDLVWLAGFVSMAPVVSTFRPQVFSVLLCVVVLDSLHRPRSRWATLPVAMMLWANLHGGWLVGICLIWGWISIEVAACRSTVSELILPIICSAATLVTPYGVGLWSFLYETVGLARPDISEWRPLTDQPMMLATWTGISLLALFSLWHTRAWDVAAVVLPLAIASTRVGRLVPFFGMTVAMLFGTRWRRSTQPSLRTGETRQAYCLAGAMVCVALVLGIRNITSTYYSPEFVFDHKTAGVLQAARPTGRMVVYFDWGEYAIWHWGPRLQVSYDGRRETVYSDQVIDANLRLYSGSRDGLCYLESLRADWVWLPKRLEAVRQIRRDDGWQVWYEGPQSIVFARRGQRPAADAPAAVPLFA